MNDDRPADERTAAAEATATIPMGQVIREFRAEAERRTPANLTDVLVTPASTGVIIARLRDQLSSLT